MQEFVEFTLGGISDGVIYAAIGLSLVLIWRGTRVLNYAQGGMAMFTSYIALIVINATGNYWLGFVVALAGMLVTPQTFLYPNSMDSIFVLGFTAAVIGGLDSPVGAIVGGLILGVLLNYVTGYVGSNLPELAGLAILILVLMFRPSGLFGSTATRQV
jgi:branched-chain amino acid transport system permease protein